MSGHPRVSATQWRSPTHGGLALRPSPSPRFLERAAYIRICSSWLPARHCADVPRPGCPRNRWSAGPGRRVLTRPQLPPPPPPLSPLSPRGDWSRYLSRDPHMLSRVGLVCTPRATTSPQAKWLSASPRSAHGRSAHLDPARTSLRRVHPLPSLTEHPSCSPTQTVQHPLSPPHHSPRSTSPPTLAVSPRRRGREPLCQPGNGGTAAACRAACLASRPWSPRPPWSGEGKGRRAGGGGVPSSAFPPPPLVQPTWRAPFED